MDKELIIYIIFIVIAILTRVLKNKKGNAPAPPRKPQEEDGSPKKSQRPLTFEELLREFTGEGSAEEPVKESRTEYAPTEQPYSYEEDDEVRQAYERSISEAKKLKTLDEQVSLDEPLTRLRPFDSYSTEEENNSADTILEALKDPDGARNAIILSEIINRKY